MRSFSEEFKAGTIEYLATLPIEDHEIVLGKYLAALGMIGSLVAFTLVYPGRSISHRPAGCGTDHRWYVSILGLASFFAAIGLWASAFTRNQWVAFIIGFFVLLRLFSFRACGGIIAGRYGQHRAGAER